MQKTPVDEMNWIAQAKEGDQRAFECLVDAYQRPVFNLCFRLLGHIQQAEDAAQEVFYKTFLYLDRFDLDRSFVNWILSIASYHCIDQLRRRDLATIPWSDLSEKVGKTGHSPEDEIVQRELVKHCQSMLNQLDPIDRAAIVLFYWYACSQAEIAEALELSISAVKSRLLRSRRRLAAFLTSQSIDQPLNEALEFNMEYSTM